MAEDTVHGEAAAAPPGTGGGFIDEDTGPVRLRDYGPEDYVVLVLFWVLAVVVFAQFFTRYVLNDSIAWTEEVARYLLITVAFLGSAIAVRKGTHIMVEFFYSYLPRSLGRVLATLVDLINIAFFAWGVVLTYQVAGLVWNQRMTSLDMSKGWIYAVVVVAFVVMTLRAVQAAVRHWRRGTSELEEFFVKAD